VLLSCDLAMCVCVDVLMSMKAFSSDGRWLISSSVDSTVKTWDLPSGKYEFHVCLI